MKPHEKLLAWRKNEAKLSIRGLVDMLEQTMAPHFPDGFPRGERIHLRDISEAERGMPSMFEKVANAIYKYMAVPEGYFGTLRVSVREYEDLEGKSIEYRDRTLELQEQLIEEKSRVIELERSRFDLQAQIHTLQMENEALKAELARLKKAEMKGNKT